MLPRAHRLHRTVQAPRAGAITTSNMHGTKKSASQPAAALVTPLAAERGVKRKRPPQDIGISSLLGYPLGEAAVAQPSPASAGAQALTPDLLAAACAHLAAADPKLVPLIAEHGPPERLLAKGGSCYATIAKSIVFQQLGTHAAAAIYGRVLAACGGVEVLTPAALLGAPRDQLRAAGLSFRKIDYLVDLSRRFADGVLSDERIAALDDGALHRELTQVKGIGDWSVDMFAMFHQGRPDCLPVGDLGVRRGMQHLYGLRELPAPDKMAEVAAKWAPFRSVGAYYMWRVVVPRAPRQSKAK